VSREAADRVAAWATGAGVGLLVLMVAWLIGNRIAGLVWDPPVGPSVAIVAATIAGAVSGLIVGRRLARRSPSSHAPAEMR